MDMDLTTIFQAMPYAQNVAHAELVHPQVQQAVSQVLARQVLEEQQKQTQPIERQDGLNTVQEDGQRQPSGQGRQGRQRRRPVPQDEQTQAANTTPFAGHILDLKI